MSFIEHPGADLTLLQCSAHGHTAQLLRGDQQDGNVAQPHPLERLGPLGHRQEPVDRDTRGDPEPLKSGHLIGHEGYEGRYHHRQGARLVVAGQRGDLVAQRLAGARRQDPQHVAALHRRFDDDLLQGVSVIVGGFGPEAVEAEEALEFPGGIVALPAPRAAQVGASVVAQAADQPPRLGELVPHPRRHHRVAPRHRQPRQRIGERPAALGGAGDEVACLGVAGDVHQAGADGVARLGEGRPGRAAQGLEDQVEARGVVAGGEPVPSDQQVRRGLEELLLLVTEDLQGQFCVEFRVVAAVSLELPVLVVLDEAVIRVAGER